MERGHRLVADDVVTIKRRAANVLIGSGNELLRHCMEIRGIGIIDVQAIFGIRAIRVQKRVEVEVNLREWDAKEDYERLGLVDAVLDHPRVSRSRSSRCRSSRARTSPSSPRPSP